MPEATCTPGQGGITAVAPTTVALRPAVGTFPNTEGEVLLISNDNDQLRAPMPIQKWNPDIIVAWLPDGNPGTGADNEYFTVVAKSGETTYEASPVWVTGPPGTGYPPTHTPV